ncbi:diaminopimelate epimerase [Altererythrobacter aquiaggeris]|uniref:diaminopimelate epimerase n=1 Tax=Aestuarierythrobacter aquiaggeris TaxID=1898396 RepID=UPI003015C1D9
MRIPFTKMHGLGNDFIVLDARAEPLPDMTRHIAASLADRKTGIGCDQLVVLEPSVSADFRMRIFNSDGGEVEACGNAARAIALMHGGPARIETGGGIIHVEPAPGGAKVDMGIPRFQWQDIPLEYAMDTAALPLSWDDLANPAAINVGNPHLVFFVADTSSVPLADLGPQIETDPVFTQGVNVNVATIVDRSHIALRVWERGAGLTRACGTGACATAVAAIRAGLVDNRVQVSLPGGKLCIEWTAGSGIMMEGPAQESFSGSFNWDDFA